MFFLGRTKDESFAPFSYSPSNLQIERQTHFQMSTCDRSFPNNHRDGPSKASHEYSLDESRNDRNVRMSVRLSVRIDPMERRRGPRRGRTNQGVNPRMHRIAAVANPATLRVTEPTSSVEGETTGGISESPLYRWWTRGSPGTLERFTERNQGVTQRTDRHQFGSLKYRLDGGHYSR